MNKKRIFVLLGVFLLPSVGFSSGFLRLVDYKSKLVNIDAGDFLYTVEWVQSSSPILKRRSFDKDEELRVFTEITCAK